MRKNLMYIALATLALASCKGGFKQGEGGLLYNIHTDKPGQNIKVGDFVSLNLTLKNEGDSVLGSTYDMGRPVPQLMQKPQQKGDISAGLLLLSEGDSATIKLSIDSMFKKGAPRPPGLKGKYVIYEVKVEKVIAKGALTDPVFQGRISDYFKVQTEAIKKAEPAKIQKFISDKKLKATKTASGLQYEITKPGSGPVPVVGDTAVVNYTGKLLNGKFFDSSLKEEALKAKQQVDPRRQFAPIRIPIGEGKVIKGWDEGLLLMNKGSKATFVIPSELAYGEQGAGGGIIPPYAPIMFEIEMVDIVKPNPNAPKTAAPQPPSVR
jgi:FKBP-type peptidyl-prolyl cis-trans isomerase FkpA